MVRILVPFSPQEAEHGENSDHWSKMQLEIFVIIRSCNLVTLLVCSVASLPVVCWNIIAETNWKVR